MDSFIKSLPPLATLRPFEAAARLESFSRAANELHLTQAAISRQIRALEEDLGVTSPSTAAGVLVGGASNGRIAWKDANGKTLKAIQDARLASI